VRTELDVSDHRATLPFVLIFAATVLLITYVPWLTTAPLHRLGR
jgi:TRAP-type C4-dicarboxylate transport system permease large subunit